MQGIQRTSKNSPRKPTAQAKPQPITNSLPLEDLKKLNNMFLPDMSKATMMPSTE
jgi:hypothetical protein